MRALAFLCLMIPATALARVTGSVGLGAVVGPLVWEQPSTRLDDTMLTSALSVGLFLGQRVTRDVALGIALDATGMVLGGAELGSTSYSPGAQIDMLVRVIIQPGIRGMVWRFSLGGAGAAFATSRSDVASPDNVATGEFLFGGLAEFSAGWVYAQNRQVALSLKAGYLVSQHMRYIPVMLTLRWHLGPY